MEQVLWADRGQSLLPEAADAVPGNRAFGVSRLGSMQLSGAQFSIWVQMRGNSWVEAREGRFPLRRGDWIAFDRESRPSVQSDRNGLCLGLGLNGDALQAVARFADSGLYAGRGRVGPGDARLLMRLWRSAVARLRHGGDADALRPILLQLAGVQHELARRVHDCPGRSRSRKRQVFARLQRARLYLEGHCDRVVRIGELAELTSFSSWYFSKTFHALYGESPQAASARMRLERAAELLRGSSMMIGEVAVASGFDNCCSFARAFRARFGMSASQFRTARAASVAGARLLQLPLRAPASRPESAKPTGAPRKAA